MPRPIPIRTKLQKEIEGLFQILPFNLLVDGVAKINRQLGYRITRARLRHLITTVRRDPSRWLFNIPLARSGGVGADERGPRYVCVMRDSNDEPYFNPEESSQVQQGLRTAVLHAKSSMQHEADALRWSLPYYSRPEITRLINSYVRKIRRIAEDATEILEAIDEQGNGDNGR